MLTAVGLVVASILSALPTPVSALDRIMFPVIGPNKYYDDFYAYRSGTTHNATDIMAAKMQPIVSASDGVVVGVWYPQPSWGYSVSVRDDQGYRYNYIHMNNDTPGTDDGNGGAMNAYAADMKVGNRVVRGQLLGWVGDSGNAETTASHLHFEIDDPSGNPVNPYPYLLASEFVARPVLYPQLANERLPYGNDFYGNGSVASGNFDTDSNPETAIGAGRGGGPHVKILDDNGKDDLTLGFFAYDPAFPGGVDVAAGDVDGDGQDEIITGAGPGGGPHVRIFEKDGTPIGGFYAYDPSFPGGVHVAAGDIDNDGTDEIITGAGRGGGPHIRAFKLDGTQVSSFFPYDVNFPGGVDVASGNVLGDDADEIVTAAGPGGGPHVAVFDKDGNVKSGFFAYEPEFPGGVRISVGQVRTGSYEQIATIPRSLGGPAEKLFNGDGSFIALRYVLESWWAGNYDVAAGSGATTFSTGGNRRMSVRAGLN